jgi:hypothetical protein
VLPAPETAEFPSPDQGLYFVAAAMQDITFSARHPFSPAPQAALINMINRSR